MIEISPKELASLLGVTTNLVYKIIQSDGLNTTQSQNNRKKLPPSTVRQILSKRGFHFKPSIIAVEGLKGGIGKTTISLALTEGAARYGIKTLVIDLDMQGNLTEYFLKSDGNTRVLVHLIKGTSKIENIIKNHSEFIDFIPSSLDNSRLEIELNKTINYKTFLRSLLAPIIDDYDLIILDCPPTLSRITTLATCAADCVLIPINTDRDSMSGLYYQLDEIYNLKKTFEIDIDYKIIWNKFDAREKLSSFYMQEIYTNDKTKDKLLPMVMRTDTTYKNAKAFKQSLFSMKKSAAKEDAEQLVKELLGLNSWIENKKTNSNSAQVA
jgi:chromosome partitioning protein